MNDWMSARPKLADLFHNLAWTLLAVFDAYEVDEKLVDQAACELQAIYHRHLGGPRHPLRGRLGLESLLDELECRLSNH